METTAQVEEWIQQPNLKKSPTAQVGKFNQQLKFKSSLRGQVVWITGASSGIGEYLAYELAKCGVKLALSGTNVENLEKVKQKCIGTTQLPLSKINHSSREECLLQKHFIVDILVNNAGRSQRAGFETIDLPVDEAMFKTNVFGAIHLTRLMVPHFKKQGRGHVVVTSSLAGKMGQYRRMSRVIVSDWMFKMVVPDWMFKMVVPDWMFKMVVPDWMFKMVVPDWMFKMVVPDWMFKMVVPDWMFKMVGARLDVQDGCARLDVQDGCARLDVQDGCTRLDVQDGCTRLDVQDGCTRLDVQDGCTRLDVQDGCTRLDVQDGGTRLDVQDGCTRLDVQDGCIRLDVQDGCAKLDVQDGCFRLDVQDDCSRLDVQDGCSRLDVQDGAPGSATYSGTKFALHQLGGKMKAGERRMSTDRCSHLCAVAIANKLDEVWIAQNPVLILFYLSQYLPTIYR
ncbi:DHRS7, partial [Cordylochernes scorpioides]